MKNFLEKSLLAMAILLMGVGVFAQGDLTVNVTTDGGTVTEYAGPYPSTTTVVAGAHNITAVPAADYKFVRWKIVSGDLVTTIADPTVAATTVTITGNSSIYAVFAADVKKDIELKAANPVAGGGPTIDVGAGAQGPGTYNVSTGKKFQIVANPAAGYNFSGWVVTGDATVVCASSEDTFVSLATATGTVEATYTAIAQTTVTSEVTPTGGGAVGGAGIGLINNSTWYNITATAATGYRFVKWTASSTEVIVQESTNNATQLYINSSTAVTGAKVTAEFETTGTSTITLNASPTAGGTVAFNGGTAGTQTVDTGSNRNWYNIQATANGGYVFTGWSIDSGDAVLNDSTLAAAQVRFLGDCTLTAGFAQTVDLTMASTAEAGSAGTTLPAVGSTTTITSGSPYAIQAFPDVVSEFVGWSVTTGTATITAANAQNTTVYLSTDATVSAEFKKKADVTTAVLTVEVTPVDGGETQQKIVGTHTLEVKKWYDIDAVANAGYRFSKWTTADGAVCNDLADPTTSVYLASAGTITATFEALSDTDRTCLTVAVSPAYGGTETQFGAGVHTVTTYTWYNVIANPTTGFKFTSWSVSENGTVRDAYTDNTWVCVKGSTTLTANFAANTAATLYQLSVGAAPSNGGDVQNQFGASIIGLNDIESGTYYKMVAVPNAGYKFSSWSVSSNVAIYGDNAETTYVMLSGDGTATANFAALGSAQLTIAVSPEDGGTEINYGAGIHTAGTGTWIDIQANPSTNYTFNGWTVSGSVTILDANSAATKIYMTGDGTATANFSFDYTPNDLAQLTLASSPGCGGLAQYWDAYQGAWQDPGTYYVNTKTSIALQATVNTGYRFTGWTYSGSVSFPDVTAQTLNVVLFGDATITANYEVTPTAALTIEISPNDNAGTETQFGVGTYTVSTQQWYNVSADPKVGYKFSYWEIETGSAVIKDKYQKNTKVCLTGSATIKAYFEAVTMAELTMAIATSGTGTTTPAEGASSVETGTWLAIDANPSTGYKFSSWSVSENAVLQSDSITANNKVMLSGDATVTATFATSTTARLTIAVSPTNSGAEGSYGVGTHTVDTGTWYQLDAAPGAGYEFSSWAVSSGSATLLDVNDSNTWVYLSGDATVTCTNTPISTPTAALTIAADPTYGVDQFFLDGNASYLGTHQVNRNVWYEIAMTGETRSYTGTGYVFTAWTVTTGDAIIRYDNTTDKYYTYLTGDATLTASLTQLSTAILTVAVSPENAGLVTDPGGEVQVGNNIAVTNQWMRVTATPYAGYAFSSWSVGENAYLTNSDDKEYAMVYITGDATLTANFETATTATLTMAVTPAGSGMPDPGLGAHIVNANQRYKMTCLPATGYLFKSWSIDQNGTLYTDECADLTDNEGHFILTGDATITATFEAASTATLTIACSPEGSGTTSPVVGAYTYNVGQKYMITAEPLKGYQFSEWQVTDGATLSGAYYDSTNKKQVVYATLASDATVTAVFVNVPTSQLTLASSPEYAIWGSLHAPGLYEGYFYIADDFDECSKSITWENWIPGTYTVFTNKTYLIYVTPIEEYSFKQWTVTGDATVVKVTDYGCWENCGSSSSSNFCSCHCHDWYFLTCTGDATVTAEFEAKSTATLTLDVSPAGAGVVGMYDSNYNEFFDMAISQTVYVGDNHLLKAYTAAGYYFQGWKVSAGDATITYGFSNDCFSEACFTINGDATVQPVFETTPPTTVPQLTMATVDSNQATTDPAAGTYSVLYDEPYSITATAEDGFYFIRWSIDTEANGSFGSVVSSDTTIRLTDDATITPVFGKRVDGALTVTSLSVKTQNDNDPEKPKDNVKVGGYFTDVTGFGDVSTTNLFYVGVDGWETSFSAWTKEPASATDKKQVYEYSSDDKVVKLKIDETTGTFDLSIKKVDIFQKLSVSDGVDVYMVMGTTKYVASVTVDEKTTWKYKAADKTNDTILTLSASYTKKNGKTEDKDKFNVQGQGLTQPTGFDETSIVKVTLTNGVSWTFDPSSDEVTVKKKNNKYTYKYVPADKTVDKTKRSLVLDFDKKWKLKIGNSSQGSKLSQDGTIVVTVEYSDSSGNSLGSDGSVVPPEGDGTTTPNTIVIKSNLTYKIRTK